MAWVRRAAILVSVAGSGMGVLVVPARAAPKAVTISVTPTTSAMDSPLAIRVTGLHAREQATLRVVSKDAVNVEWSSEATLVADRRGEIDPAQIAPRSGSYRGVRPMGLLEAMVPPLHCPTTPGCGKYSYLAQPMQFRFTVVPARSERASTSVMRGTPIALQPF
jgi:acyl-CoA thioester hydrolase/bile acid acetyltransferase-like protein